jgi:hypothetical protein
MPRLFIRLHFPIIIILLSLIGMLPLTSCSYGQAGPLAYDSGTNNLTLTGSQLIQYNLIRFDTVAAERTLTLPSAADISSAISSVPEGTFTAIVVVADGPKNVKIAGGTNVIVKDSASSVKANTSQTVFIVLTNVSSGSQQVTVY